ncbi:MAG: hypothetical protein A3I05_00450 [Deltaproteobacteria bacterium RIFCSPLOWO2_02_FULL_44_10]|nr:MAG: hypothetical protein A3C46_01320 [Deltaproteobacteria bacterium RIFCSPHIGHO2_02_FULL_44_16]OGQ47274.1 MAG: hypothetical protein A3I05_00450 [Deltaproteobacteria bacterium RIFCSPLOWO2_02_FULL_44_10]
MIPFWSVIPFIVLLLIIALLPIIAPHFWESNRHKSILVFIVSLPVLFLFLQRNPAAILHTLEEYFSFILLLTSLYVISGGICLTGDLKATPVVNTTFLALGAILANLIGTTGASMILIRPFLKTNSERKNVAHLSVFFIFIVSNCGGLLTPLGDPPLFLGYLQGVPFFWTFTLFPIWCCMNFALLGIFFFFDTRAYRRESKKSLQLDATHLQPLRLQGSRNFLFLGGVLCAVFLNTPWRELIMILMMLLSFMVGSKKARARNQFTWGPIVEVAILFAGIFITMVPALMFLKEHAVAFGIVKPWQFFWTTGIVSGFLDNAPAYLTFLTLAQGLGLPPEVAGIPESILKAISVGAVFMGANSYIGNGPNFMVRAIAEHAGFKPPSFFHYMLYAALVLFPLYGMIHLIFF